MKPDHEFSDRWKGLNGSVKLKVAVLYRWDEVLIDAIEASGRFYVKVK